MAVTDGGIAASGRRNGTGAIGLGIDAGGTYTDAVLYDLGRRQLVAKAKALTTYHDFVVGIREALAQLPADLLGRSAVTALSTTLATNSVVEGRGQKVGLIVLAPWEWFAEDIGHQPYVRVPGCVDAAGQVMEPLDEDACRRAVDHLLSRERCAAIAVAGYGAIRNPAQANRVREIVHEHSDTPVVCAHELSRRLNAVQGARTAVSNARLLPVIGHLLDSVRSALAELGIGGPLMVVKGDGTPVDEGVARQRPIETILSGPAASVSGVRALTGLSDALVMDVGGTTTDCAILEDGHVAVAPDGARVGPWSMGVDVVDICTVGLGGDSRLSFTPEGDLRIGPERSVPLCYVAAQHPCVAAFLRGFDLKRWRCSRDATALDVLVTGGPARLSLTAREAALLELVSRGPIPIMEAGARLSVPTYTLLPIERLEECGAIKRAALTPTDLLHVAGEFQRWDAEAARNALRIFAAMWGRSPDETLAAARELLTRRVFEEALRREVVHADRRMHDLPAEWGFLLDRSADGHGNGMRLQFSLRRPIVAIGAPASVLVPPVRRHLDAEVVVPEHADVANAIGAIGTEIRVREEVLIRPNCTRDGIRGYFVYSVQGRLEFDTLEDATARAREVASECAARSATASGARRPHVRLVERDGTGTTSESGTIFLERTIVAEVSGVAFEG